MGRERCIGIYALPEVILTKNNRSPGPDGIPVEFLKLLDDKGLELVCNILRNCWEKEIMPDEMEPQN